MFAPDDGTRAAALLRARLHLALESVTEEWHWYQREQSSLLRVWLHFRHALVLRLHCTGDLLHLQESVPGGSYDMGEYGEGRVGPAQAPSLLTKYVGSRLRDATLIRESSTEPSVGGVLLSFDAGDLTVASSADEWLITTDELPPDAAPHHHIETMTITGRPWPRR
ncbi:MULTISPECIES: hypothetical protein [Amycolatopsis]|uniref:Uncharacterized protein n=1 Tax=Amycolatopsis bullii TaxID=941987 RepID=A0ABQ3KJT8_9PSEU|nr:hypothetical protein [Amycolatopsis bullii]GHG29854.1 hypothetical protein GCM10017567_57000 [Amycolatopsis bullii]